MDFKPYKQDFKQFGQYIRKFLADLHDPRYVDTLYKVGTNKGYSSNRREENKTNIFFIDGICTQSTYQCRIQNQFIQLRNEANKVIYVLWRIYRVHSNVKGVKPIVKIFNDKKDNLFNIGDIVSNRLQTLETKFSSLLGFVTPDASPKTDLALPSTSDWPTSPPRRESIPMLDLHITPEDIQETVKDLEK